MEPASHGRAARLLIAVTAGLSLLLGTVGTIALGTVWLANASGTSCFDGGPPPCRKLDEASLGRCTEGACTYLIMGSDSRRGLTPEELRQFGTDKDIGGENRADTIMLLRADPAKGKAVVLSFPRDLWVAVPGHGFRKINTAFEGGINGGGPLLMARTIHRLTGIRIDHFLYVDLAGFQDIVDRLGGVELNIPTRLDDELTDLHLRAGTQVLDGHDALGYVRTRALPCDERNPDFARIGRQQQFLRALINRMLQPAQLARAPALVGPVLGNLRRDPELEIPDLAYLVGQLRGVDTGAVEFRAVPGSSKLIRPAGFPSGLAIVEMHPSADRLFDAIRRGGALPSVGSELEGIPRSPANIRVPIVDVGASSEAAEVLNLLSVSGFDIRDGVVSASELVVPTDRSAIVFGPKDLELAQVVQQHLPQLSLVEVKDHRGVAVVVTDDFRAQVPGTATGAAPGDCIGIAV